MRSFVSRLASMGFVLGLAVAPVSSAFAESVIRFVPTSDLQVLDPIWTTATVTKAHGYLIYDTLFAADDQGVAQPQMVDRFEVSNDGKIYRFALRNGLQWHDGTPVTAEDCVASIQRWSARDGAGQLLSKKTKAWRVVDDKTFELELTEPFGVVIDLLAKNASNVPFMMPKRVAEQDPQKQITEFIGSGPFIFSKEDWVPGSEVVYKKNESYVPRSEPSSGFAGGKVAKVDRVEWNIVPDRQTAFSALSAGEVDIWENPSIDILPAIESTPGVAVSVINKPGWFGYIVPNHRSPPFDKPQAREALARLIDQTAYLQAIAGNPSYYKTCLSMFACGTPMASDVGSDAARRHDPEKAKTLFQESGWDFATSLVLLDPTDDPEMHAASLVTAQALRSIGLTVDVQAMDWATLTKRRAVTEAPGKGGWNLFTTYGSGYTYSNPFYGAAYSASCEKAWYSGACDETLEALRTAWAVQTGLKEKQDVARQYQERAFEIASPWIPFGQWTPPIAHRSNVTGIVSSGDVVVFWNVEKR